jgi:hypothetical protein
MVKRIPEESVVDKSSCSFFKLITGNIWVKLVIGRVTGLGSVKTAYSNIGGTWKSDAIVPKVVIVRV